MLLGSISLDENLPADSVVTTLGALDPDNDVGDTHTFSLIEGKGGDDNTSFYIDGNELKATAPFDYETKSEYKIRLQLPMRLVFTWIRKPPYPFWMSMMPR